ncbi:hypothetical protein HUW46_05122 [Amycolatopsis sp. CA-230715]|nr:DUF2530 domain-containing protein [Amycolatopsis sp. CA-230715]QWF81689.1 hypothetical protein HUW46_05122 [Amycolatopsis sp. CA-230715]
MAEPINAGDVKGSLRPTPELPERLIALFPVVVAGTAVWLVAFVVLLVLRLNSALADTTWLWTSLAGIVISLIGMGIMTWQRAAAKRGSKTAQRVR